MTLAHGGTAGLAVELAVLVVPLLVCALLLWWAHRHGKAEEGEADREELGKG